MNASHSINLFKNSCHHVSTIGKALPQPYKNQQQPTTPQFVLTKRSRSKRQLSTPFTVVIRPLSTRLMKLNFHVSLSHRRNTTVSKSF